MPDPIDKSLTKPSRWTPRFHPLMVTAGFLFLALGGFVLSLGGGWVWLGALVWGIAAVLLTSALIRSVENPTPDISRQDALRAQLKRLDQACEGLQDQNWELREAEQKYKTLLNRQGDIILHLAEDGSVRYANNAFGQYFDATKGGSPFQPWSETDDIEAADLNVPGTDPLWERRIETIQGPCWFRWTETLIRSTQKDRGLRLVIARDVTAFKKVEAASEAKSRFLATVSHEMRTPLNGIIGMATLLEATPLTSEQSSYSQALRQSGTALLALVNDVLDLSRIEAGKLTFSHEWSSPVRLMEDVVELLAPDAQEKGLSVASWIGPDVPAKLLIDPVRMRQILVNLLGNAIKFTSDGAINLSLECDSPPAEGEPATILLSVRDTGPGIAEDMQTKLFEEFEQADTTRTRHHEGTGLGLAISRRLARMMDGDILLASKLGKGSTFTLQVSASWLSDDDSDATHKPDMAASGGAPLDGDVLVGIDLTQADQRALYSYCRDWGMEFHAFTLSQWDESGDALTPDHLLINGAEPDKAAQIIGGFDPLRGGRLTRPLPRSRIILLEPGERRVIPQMRDSGISGYLVKPMRQTSLRLALLGHPANRDLDDEALAISTPIVSEVQTELSETSNVNVSFEMQDKRTAHILLVEDNDINALLARTILTKSDMQVSLAKSGKEALSLYESEAQFDLALLDLHMPDMDGVTLFDLLEKQDTLSGRQIPKVAFTADALQETRDNCLAHGFADFIVKPVDPDKLVTIVKQSLEQSK